MPQDEDARFYLDLLRGYLDSTNDAIFVLCDEMKFLLCNTVAETWFGHSESQLTRHNERTPITELISDKESLERFRENFNLALTRKQPRRFECYLEPGSLEPFWAEFSISRVVSEVGEMVIAIGRDVSVYRKTEGEMLKLYHAIEQTADIVVISDRDGNIEYINPAFESVTGYTADEVIGHKTGFLKSGQHDEAFYRNLWQTILAGSPFTELFINLKKDGSYYYEEKTISPLTNEDGVITHFIATGKDVTDRVEDQHRINRLAYYDPLTVLPNRQLLLDRLEHATARAQREERSVAVLLLDLDRFKAVNDSLGHEIGNLLIKEVANRLKGFVREGDTVARIGGDEFALIVEGLENINDIDLIAEKILDLINQPFTIKNSDVSISASIGVSIYPDDGTDQQELLMNADAAMSRAQLDGGGRYCFFAHEITSQMRRRITLEQELRRALSGDEFVLYYQPIIDLVRGKVVGVEALVRWQHPGRGVVEPGEFISIMEETGLIKPLGEWILQTVCVQGRVWQSRFEDAPRISVNISARQFHELDFQDTVSRNLGPCCLGTGMIEFEITENVLMENLESIYSTLKTLSGFGISLAVDDFGTGYSSLSYLKRFNVDTLKIDREFVRELGSSSEDTAIIKAVIVMARSLNLNVIAEGVETVEQLAFLKDHGCQMAQGYLFSRPQPVPALEEIFHQGKTELFEPLVARETSERT